MKYYSLKYVSSLKDGFGGLAKMWKIEILEMYRGDKGLLEHEKFHVREWWAWMVGTWLAAVALTLAGSSVWPVLIALSPFVKGLVYRLKPYRKWSEVRAYRIQLKKGTYASPQFAVNALMHKYDLDMSERKARKALGL